MALEVSPMRKIDTTGGSDVLSAFVDSRRIFFEERPRAIEINLDTRRHKRFHPSRMKSTSRHTIVRLGVILSAAIALLSTPALAILKERDNAPNARVEDADGKAVETKSLKGKPVFIVYDDRTSAPSSEAFRKKLVAMLKSPPYASKVSILIIADTHSYDFWPARAAVLRSVRDESKKQGTTVYCDWTGNLRKGYKIPDEKTGVILIGKDGRIAFGSDGIPTAENQKRLIEKIKAEVESP